MTTPEPVAPQRAARFAAEIAPVALALGFLFWEVRSILSPLVAYAVLCLLLWPHRREPAAGRTLVVTGVLATVWFLWANGGLLAPFLLALVIAYLLSPAVQSLEARRVPRPLAIGLVLAPFLVAIVVLPLLLVPALERQIVDLTSRIPDAARRLADWALAQRTRLLTTGLLTEEQAAWLHNLQTSDLAALVTERWDQIARRMWAAFLGIGKGVSVLFTVFGYIVITPVVTFYVLKAWPRLTARLGEAVPPARRAEVTTFAQEYDRALGRYMRGQLTEASIVAILTSAGLAALGFPGALLIGVFAGICNVIPYVGLWISVIPGVFLALVSGAVVANLLKLVAVFVVVQFVDGSITGPRIVGDSVGLNPVWVMIALALFGSLLGFVGLLLAVPLAVLVKMLAARAWARYQDLPLYTAGAATGAPAGA